MYPLPDGCFAPRNQWYIAAWSSEVSRSPIERMILDEPVALYRRQDGSPVAVEGRCPHRSFPLGHSRVVGDDIECGYHGLTFRPDGSCASIPSQPTIPRVCRIRSYPIVERWQWLWIWTGDPALADEALIPDHHAIGLTDPRYGIAGDVYHFVDARYMLLHDNLFDLTHIGFLHKDTFGEGASAEEPPVFGSGENWIESRFEQADIPCPPYFAALLGHEGRIARRFGLRLYLPCLHVGGDDISTLSGEHLGSLRVYHGVTPATQTSSHYFWAVGHDWAHPDPDHARNIATGLLPALAEDVSAAHHVEAMIAKVGPRPSELLLKADNVCVLGRRAFEALIRAEQAEETMTIKGKEEA